MFAQYFHYYAVILGGRLCGHGVYSEDCIFVNRSLLAFIIKQTNDFHYLLIGGCVGKHSLLTIMLFPCCFWFHARNLLQLLPTALN